MVVSERHLRLPAFSRRHGTCPPLSESADVGATCDRHDMDDSRTLRGIELRYALTQYLSQHGRCSIAALVDALTHQGFVIHGNPPNSVSDALRWEMAHGRVFRRGRGVYDAFEMPRSTEYRIHQRVLALLAQAERIRSEAGSGDGPFRSPNAKPV